jgi:dihydroorotate dehydrogenase
MREKAFVIKSKTTGFLYRNITKQIFFRLDPESVHDRMIRIGVLLGSSKPARRFTSWFFHYENRPYLEQRLLGITFSNPIGLAAGFDKNAQLTDILPAVGFGFAEVGSVTGEPCPGNPKPRLWRLKNSQSLGVYYGLKNDGCEVIAKRLCDKEFRIPIGLSVAKTNSPETVETKKGVEDYAKAFSYFRNIGRYITVNISCPNTYGGEPFTDPKKLDQLFDRLDTIPTAHPIFIKISPDLHKDQIDKLIKVVEKHRIHGFICTNLTKRRDLPSIKDKVPEKGGLSGKVVEGLADDLIEYVYRKTNGQYTIIGCGGVFSAEDAYKKIRKGASLVQLITGMIYQGPQLIGEINCGLVQLLKRDGFKNVREAVGVDTKTAYR